MVKTLKQYIKEVLFVHFYALFSQKLTKTTGEMYV
tara:strand:+ start:2067 stop:2171 length:105 start_codon:yes stop_codon:yes gene_type:complete